MEITNPQILALLDRLNDIAVKAGWIWQQREFSLGSCYTRSKYLQAQVLKPGVTLDQVLHSWENEPLKVECKTGLHILFVYLCIEVYGKEYFEKDMDRLNYSEGPSNTTFFFSLPFSSDMKPVEPGKLSNSLFPVVNNARFDYVYLRGIKAYEHRQQYFPSLTPSFQGENLVRFKPNTDPKEDQYIGFWHRGDTGKYIVRRKADIQKDLIENGRRDFKTCYPDLRKALTEENKRLGDLSAEGRPIITVLSWKKHFIYLEDQDRYAPYQDGSGDGILNNPGPPNQRSTLSS